MPRPLLKFDRAVRIRVALAFFIHATAHGAPVPGELTATGQISTLVETLITDFRRGSTFGVELTALGLSPEGVAQLVRLRLPPTFYRELAPHRVTRLDGEPARWQACWRLCRRDPRGADAIGCLRRVVLANNHADRDSRVEAKLRQPVRFTTATGLFEVSDADPGFVPVPRELPQRSWSGLRFHVPLPLESTTPAMAKRAIRLRGGEISPTPESADVLLLPDGADACAFDQSACPLAPLPALMRGVPVLYERNLEATPRVLPAP